MKNFTYKTLLLLLLLASSFSNANAQYDVHFTNQQLRIDYYIFGNADTCYYALDKYVMEPVWGGTRNNLVDSLGYGDYFVEVLLHDSDVVIYSRGYCNLFGEWQTIPEAEYTTKGFNESVIIPYPKEVVDVVFYLRNYDGIFVEMMRLVVDPNDYFIQNAPTPPYSVLNVHGNYAPEKAVDIVILPDGYSEEMMLNIFNPEGETIDLSKPFRKVTMCEVIKEETGIDIPLESREPFFNIIYMNKDYPSNGINTKTICQNKYEIIKKTIGVVLLVAAVPIGVEAIAINLLLSNFFNFFTSHKGMSSTFFKANNIITSFI